MTDGLDLVLTLATTYFLPSILVLLACIAGLYVRAGQWVNAGCWLFFGGSLGAAELASISMTGKTISENHWFLDQSNPELGLEINLLIGGLLLIVAVHLAKITIERMRQEPK